MKTAYWLLRQVIRAILITVVLSALTHLAILFGDFAMTGNVAYINPITFLGINTVAPQYENSSRAVAVGWIILITIGTVIFVIKNREFIKQQIALVKRVLNTPVSAVIFRAFDYAMNESDHDNR